MTLSETISHVSMLAAYARSEPSLASLDALELLEVFTALRAVQEARVCAAAQAESLKISIASIGKSK